MKHAKVIPAHKKGNKHDISNYRPISLLSSFSKIFEKVLYIRLSSFLDHCSILSTAQYGFMKKRSTADALSQIISFIQQQQNKDISCLVILIDLKKAFDTVNHAILIKKLENMGIRGTPLNLLSSYLTNRSQSTYLDGISSTSLPITSGVPQGSILGPLLYLIFVNDFSHSIPAKSILFADDTTILISGHSLSDLCLKFDTCKPFLETWMTANRLYINLEKTFYLLFGKMSKKDISLTLFNTPISRCFSTPLLGLHLDSQFHWKDHIKKVLSKLLPLKAIFYQIRDKLTPSSKYLLYHSLVESRINYCIEFYGNASSSALKLILITQKKILKLLFGLNLRYSSKDLFNSLHIAPFNVLYKYRLFTIAHKAIHSNIIHFPPELLNISPSTRHNFTCILNHSKLMNKDFIYNLLTNWNSINDLVRATPCLIASLKLLQDSGISSTTN
jgi:hypothetical protein